MSWGLHSRASIYLSRHHVRVRVWRVGLLRDAMIDERVIPSDTLEHAIDETLHHIAKVGGAGSRVTIFLGASESILDVVTAVPGLRGDGDWRTLAQRRLLFDAGIDPDQWRVRYTLLPGAHQAFAAAIPVWLCKRCDEISRRNRLSIAALHLFALRCLGYTAACPQNLAFQLFEPGAVTRFIRSDAWSIMVVPNTPAARSEDALSSLNIGGASANVHQIVAELGYANPQTPSAALRTTALEDYADLLSWTAQ